MPSKSPVPAAATVHHRRLYADCRYGQMHVHSAFSSNGGFDERTPLVCLHPATATGRLFDRLSQRLGTDRSIYAPDLPGLGESDPPPSQPSVADYAAAIGDFLDHMMLRRVDLLGCRLGSSVAAELAIARPQQVRRIVLLGVPPSDAAEREAQGGADRLPRVGQPMLILRPYDAPRDVTARARAMLPEAKFIDLPECSDDDLGTVPDAIATPVRNFLD